MTLLEIITVVLSESIPKVKGDLVSANNSMSNMLMYVFIFPDEDCTVRLIIKPTVVILLHRPFGNKIVMTCAMYFFSYFYLLSSNNNGLYYCLINIVWPFWMILMSLGLLKI